MPFALAAVAMLLLIGGLIYWKTSSDKQEPVAATTVSVAPTAPPPPTLEEPPPPPPPVAEPEDAGAPGVKGTKKVASTTTSVGGCGGECNGTEAPSFRAQLAGVARRAHGCYERALRNNDMLEGRMTVSLRVGTSGQVCSANVSSNQTGDPALSNCVTQIFRSAQFSAPQKACVEAQVPLNFVKKQ